MNPYIYTFIREDISPEQKIVQLGHATWEAGQLFKKPKEIASLILLSAKNELDLQYISEILNFRGIEHYMFFEPDLGSHTAICTRPVYDTRERSLFKKYTLYSCTI